MQQNFYLPKSREELKSIFQEVINESGILSGNKNIELINKNPLTRKEAAAYLKISLPTLNQRTKEGLISVSRIGNRVLYSQADLDELLNNAKLKNPKK